MHLSGDVITPLTRSVSLWCESELNSCMLDLIIDSTAGLATKPQGADNSSINLFSLATAPPVCVKIVFHLIRMQYSSCISITEVSESLLLMPRPWPCLQSLPDQWPLRGQVWIVSHKQDGWSKNNSAPSSHSCWSYIVDWASPQMLIHPSV